MRNQIKHFIRYGTHADKGFLLGDFRNGYDAIIINGNMLSNSENAMSVFVFKAQKPFLIDPQTHAFQHDPKFIINDKGEVKSSIKKLAKSFGDLCVKAVEEKRALKASDIDVSDNFVRSVINFEKNKIKKIVLDSEDSDYISFNQDTSNQDFLEPIGVIAPYFYMEPTTIDEWLPVNIALVNKTKELVGSDTIVFAEIVISKEILNNTTLINKVINDYTNSNCDEILIWIDSFCEDEQEASSLNNLLHFIQQLRVSGKNVYNLFGGYFSILLTKLENGLNGVSHGLGYGEYRGVIPVGGGIPLVKYYFPPFHSRLKLEDFRRIQLSKGWQDGASNTDFSSLVCNCPSCYDMRKFEDTLPPRKVGKQKRAFPTTIAKEHNLKHYLYCKSKEFDTVDRELIEALTNKMATDYAYYSKFVDNNLIEHLDRWDTLLKA